MRRGWDAATSAPGDASAVACQGPEGQGERHPQLLGFFLARH